MPVGKASIRRAANAGVKAEKANVSKKPVQSVVSPINSEEIQMKFFAKKPVQAEPGKPIGILEELPDHLL